MKYKGCNGQVKVGAGLESIVELIGFAVDENVESLDATVIGADNARRVVKGTSAWSGSIDTYYDPNSSTAALLVTGEDVLLTMNPAGDTPGLQELTGQALILTAGLPVEIDGMIQQSFTFNGNGLLNKSVIV